MADESTRQLILEALVTRVSAIDGTPPFQTTAGARVYLYEVPDLGPDDPDQAVSILPQDDEVQHQAENVLVHWPIEIRALVKASLANPMLVVEAVVADIKRGVETADRRLGLPGAVRDRMRRGTTQAFPREPGTTTVGAGIRYEIPFIEGWGTP